jgi:type I restriction enzyme S subunit
MTAFDDTWREVRVGDLGEVLTGRTPPSTRPGCFGEVYPFITPGDMHQGKYARKTERCLSDEGAALLSRIKVPANSVCVSCIGWQMGETIITDKVSFTNQQINTIVPRASCDPSYLYYSFRLRKRELLSLGSAAGARTPILNKSAFCNLKIKLPSLPVQQRIASILGTYDDLIEVNQRRIALLEEMARQLFDEWFVRFRFPGFEKSVCQSASPDDIPLGWEVRTVEELVKRIPVGKKYDQKTVCATGSIPVLDQGRSGIIGYHDEQPGVAASEGSPIIVFANHTCYKRIIHFPFSAIQNVLPFVPHPSIPRNIYWLHWATNGLVTFNDYKGHWPEFISKSVVVPPTDLAERFGRLAGPIARFVLKLERANDVLSRTRDLLLPRLISGELSFAAAEHDLEAVA